jgi:hypothetical protein
MDLTHTGYRFNIRERLSYLTPNLREKVLDNIARAARVSRGKIKKIMYLKIEEDYNVDWDVIAAFAIMFKVPPEQLDNRYSVFTKFVLNE